MDNNVLVQEGFIGQVSVIVPRQVLEPLWNKSFIENLYVSDIGYYPKAAKHYRYREEGSPEYILIYCVEGKGWVESSKGRAVVEPNQYVILPVNQAHRYGADARYPWSIYWIHFGGKQGKDFYKAYEKLAVDAIPVDLPFTSERVALFKKILDSMGRKWSAENFRYGSILGMHLLATFMFEKEKVLPVKTRDLVEQMIAYMGENLERNLSMDELSAYFNYSSSYLFSLFKQQTGYAILRYYKLLKIQKACEQLDFTDLAIKEIAYELGFQDPLYFSRLFKKYMGRSPRQYRQGRN